MPINTSTDINLIKGKSSFMKNPISTVKLTRQRYDKVLCKTITEVLVQFKNEPESWIPYDTLLAINEYYDLA